MLTRSRIAFLCFALSIFAVGCGATPKIVDEAQASVVGTPTGIATSNIPDPVCQKSYQHFRQQIEDSQALSDEAFQEKTGISRLEAFAWQNDPAGIERALSGDVDARDVTRSIAAAAMANSVDALRTMLTQRSITTDENMAAGLISASQCGNSLSVKELLSLGADPNLKNEEGVDAVMMSLGSGYFDVAELLLEAGYESCGVMTSNGKTIQELAAMVGAEAISATLPSCK